MMALELATAVAGATIVATGTAIPVAIDPAATAVTITRVIRDCLARIASSKGVGRGQEPAQGETRRPTDYTVASSNFRAPLSYALNVSFSSQPDQPLVCQSTLPSNDPGNYRRNDHCNDH